MMKEKWAVIDIGSNTIRLVIYIKSQSGSIRKLKILKQLRD